MKYAYEELSKISPRFTIAAAFGNVHGVYKPGNVKLTPKILKTLRISFKEI
jgi:fructose-bisphosphate aldolase class II